MNNFQQPIFYAVIMLLAGIGIPMMAALNSNLGTKLGSSALATTILFAVGGIVSLVHFILSSDEFRLVSRETIPIYYYLGGFFVMFYIISMTSIAPKFGVANSISVVLLGQLISMVIIDHYGFLGSQQHSFSIQKLAGITLIIIGVLLVVRRF